MSNPYEPDFDDDEPEDEHAWAELRRSMGPDGQCGQAGSEYCEFDCPFRN